ncbi:peptide chain release factor N(5)-glutamine methyltransferase [Vibrio gallicus]|uniref:peptide chain release factor N(5)-glutamine methyltransferase n=1 Tax=Vibrio gallicus TaxID=190897 RepID=UPI0021C3EEC5|nr:peptide chain release factor N(5)-glutamine methyltransferase [Vibrio gallicus]
MNSLPNIEQAQLRAFERFKAAGISSAGIDAQVLLCHAIEQSRTYLFTWSDKLLTEAQSEAYELAISRREKGEPVAYIVGTREFWSLPLKVSPHTLIPRPDTERLVELALEKMGDQPGTGLDLGTGTGAIALALASERKDFQMLGVDLQPQAQALATENAQALNITNASFLQGSWFDPIADGDKFDIIVSNPPYIDEQDPHLAQGDVRFEPDSALIAKENGLADLRYIAEHGRTYLNEGAWLLMEHGYDQGQATRDILLGLGFQQVTTEQDYAGIDRVTLGQYKGL